MKTPPHRRDHYSPILNHPITAGCEWSELPKIGTIRVAQRAGPNSAGKGHTGPNVIIIEFIIFVVSSGLFYSGRFREHLWAWAIAGAVATGSSLLFFYDLYEKLQAHPEAPARVVRVVQRVPVIQHVSQPPALSKPGNCRDDYPFFGRIFGREARWSLFGLRRRHGARRQGRQISSDGLDDAAVDAWASGTPPRGPGRPAGRCP